MKIKASELIDPALDWAVGVCVRLDSPKGEIVWETPDLRYVWPAKAGKRLPPWWAPSRNWSQCGPIIERERMHLCPIIDVDENGNRWSSWPDAMPFRGREWRGPTPLIAAMRCFVASRLGDEVEIPEELM